MRTTALKEKSFAQRTPEPRSQNNALCRARSGADHSIWKLQSALGSQPMLRLLHSSAKPLRGSGQMRLVTPMRRSQLRMLGCFPHSMPQTEGRLGCQLLSIVVPQSVVLLSHPHPRACRPDRSVSKVVTISACLACGMNPCPVPMYWRTKGRGVDGANG
jgi:hypothetical protein